MDKKQPANREEIQQTDSKVKTNYKPKFISQINEAGANIAFVFFIIAIIIIVLLAFFSVIIISLHLHFFDNSTNLGIFIGLFVLGCSEGAVSYIVLTAKIVEYQDEQKYKEECKRQEEIKRQQEEEEIKRQQEEQERIRLAEEEIKRQQEEQEYIRFAEEMRLEEEERDRIGKIIYDLIFYKILVNKNFCDLVSGLLSKNVYLDFDYWPTSKHLALNKSDDTDNYLFCIYRESAYTYLIKKLKNRVSDFAQHFLNYAQQHKDGLIPLNIVPEEIKKFYSVVIQQKILEEEPYIEEASILYIAIMNYNKIEIYREKFSKKYNIDENTPIEETIRKIYKDYNEENILGVLTLFYMKKENMKGLEVSLYAGKLKEEYNKVVESIKNERYLNELLGKGENKITINDVDNMNGSEFEKFIADLFCKMGYDAKATQVSGDFGVDIIAKKSLETIAIQAKRYSQPVGIHAIMEVVGGAKKYGADKCMVITNNGFTAAAVSLAKTNDVELWGREKLIEYMERYL